MREEILAAAAGLLQAQGDVRAVTLRAIARHVGIAAPSIYSHFPDTEAIIAALVAQTFEALTLALRASRDGIDDPVERLVSQCYAYVDFAKRHPGLYRVLFARNREFGGEDDALSSDPRSARSAARRDATIVVAGQPAFDILVDAIEACVAAGRSRSTHSFLDAVGLWSALHGYIGLRAAAPEFPWPNEQSVIDALIFGQARLE